MEKLLIMCEGPNEKEIIKILLENDLLKFTEDDLLGLTPYHARQIKSSGQVKTELNIYPGQVRILRIGDKQSDKLVIPSEYKDKILSVDKYCTKPELEMLFILAENLEQDFGKLKSSMKPLPKNIYTSEKETMITVRPSTRNISGEIQSFL